MDFFANVFSRTNTLALEVSLKLSSFYKLFPVITVPPHVLCCLIPPLSYIYQVMKGTVQIPGKEKGTVLMQG